MAMLNNQRVYGLVIAQELYLMDLVQSGQPAGGRVSLNLIQQAIDVPNSRWLVDY